MDMREVIRSRTASLCQSALLRDEVTLENVPALQEFFPGSLPRGANFRVCEVVMNLPVRGPTRVHAGYFEACNVVAGGQQFGCQEANARTEALLYEVISIPDQLDNSMVNSVRMWSALSQALIQQRFYQGR